MRSMTAFSRYQAQSGHSVFVWEIRSVNHRYLEVSWRLPEAFRFIETALREQLGKDIFRGKIECTLKIQSVEKASQNWSLDKKRAVAIMKSAKTLEQEYGILNDISVSSVLSFPEILTAESIDQQDIFPDIKIAFNEAVQQLLSLRQKEGMDIRQMLVERIEQLKAILKMIRHEVGEINQQLRAKLYKRLEEFKVAIDSQRMEQEIALMLNRMDISEEIDRLEAHVQQVTDVIEQQGAIGRKLDFLMQEMNREANTLGAKSDNIHLTRNAVELKVLIEQMREQIQNIE